MNYLHYTHHLRRTGRIIRQYNAEAMEVEMVRRGLLGAFVVVTCMFGTAAALSLPPDCFEILAEDNVTVELIEKYCHTSPWQTSAVLAALDAVPAATDADSFMLFQDHLKSLLRSMSLKIEGLRTGVEQLLSAQKKKSLELEGDLRSLEEALSLPIYFFHAKSKKTSSERAMSYITSRSETVVRLGPNDPTLIEFPGRITGGFRPKNSKVVSERDDQFLILFRDNQPLPPPGEAFLVRIERGYYYSLRLLGATKDHPQDLRVRILEQ